MSTTETTNRRRDAAATSRPLRHEDLRALSEHRGRSVSLFLPTHRAGAQIEQDPIRLKNLLTEAQQKLLSLGTEEDAAAALLKPAKALLDDADFWRHQSDGLAILLGADDPLVYRLPIRFKDVAFVGERFLLRPFLSMLELGGRFHVLTLSRGSVRLFAATPHSCNEVELADSVPRRLTDAVGEDFEDATLQVRSQKTGGGGRGEAISHSHGARSDDRDVELRRFLEILDRELRAELSRREAADLPIVLAGVDEVVAEFRQVSKGLDLLAENLRGNFDNLSGDQLHQRALEVVSPVFAKGRQEAHDRFAEAHGTGRASDRLSEILDAAHDGRVEVVFVPSDRPVWGIYDANARETQRLDGPEAGADDLLDVAALQSLLTGATVYATPSDEMPGGGDAAAVFRY